GVSTAGIALVCIRDSVLVAQAGHELRQALAKRGGKKSALLVALAITREGMRGLFFEEGEGDGSGARVEKERVGEEILRASLGGGFDESFELARIVGDAGKHGRTDHSSGNAREIELTNRFEAQIWTRCARLKDARKIRIDSGDREIHEETVVAG